MPSAKRSMTSLGRASSAIADQRFHFLDMIAFARLDAQVRAQIVGQTIVAVARDGGIAMRFGLVQRPRHSLGRREIEQILRHVGAGGDRAQEELLRPLMQSEQAEDRPAGVERFGGVVDHLRGGFGGLERRRAPRRKQTGILRAE